MMDVQECPGVPPSEDWVRSFYGERTVLYKEAQLAGNDGTMMVST